MSYDRWKSTDPADMDPYRDNDCPSCGASEGYRCAPECDCEACLKAEAEEGRQKGDDDGMEYGHPGDRLAGRE